ncbi:MAG: Ig-like domain-containing protein, partial [Pseudomonadota bacterium]
GATGVSTSSTVTATFNVDMNASTLTNATFALGQGTLLTPVTGSVSYSSSNRTVTFTPSTALQANTLYTATLSTGAQGSGGCALQYAKTWSFTTGSGGATSGCIDPISISLSQTCGDVNEPVTITVNSQASGLKYKFFAGLYDYCAGESPSWAILRDWSTTNTYTYTPTSEGRMIFYVWVASDTTNPCTGFAAISYTVGQTSSGGTGTLQVTVVDATNANPISGASLSFAGSSGSTSSSGVYTFSNVAAGTNTLTTSKSGYITNTQSETLTAGESKQITVALSPQMAAGQMRIVLTWGASPSDLDSHLTGPPASGTTRFHVYYSNKTPSGADANLDVDDTSSYGPETITIAQLHSGPYKYYLHDYTNKSATSSSAMAQSGAKVQVYSGSSLVATYNVPSGAGTLWYVFSMDGTSGAITPQNQMMYESSPTGPSIQSAGAELGVFQNLPEK